MSVASMYSAVRAHLQTVVNPQTAVEIGRAPDEAPYVIIWPAPGSAVGEQRVDGTVGSEAVHVVFQVTTAAPSALYLLDVTRRVTAALTDLRIDNRLVQPDVVANRAATPLADESVSPTRHYIATTWQITMKESTA